MTKARKDAEQAQENPALPEENQGLVFVSNDHGEALSNTGEPHSQTSNSTNRPGSSLARTLWRVIVFLFNLGVIIVIVSAIAAGVYFGWPIVYNQYILPVQNNTAQQALLEKNQEKTNQQLAGMETQVAALLNQQAQQAEALKELGSRAEMLETEVSAQNRSLAALGEIQTALVKMQAEQQADKLALNSELDRQIKILRGMELLSRARLFLYQSNFGLAKADVQAARDILAAVQASATEPLAKEQAEVVQRLDLCLSRLPDYPVAASDDLDIAWQVLLQGIPPVVIESATPTPQATIEITETPAATITLEPAISPTATIDLTPTP
jgi:hypothetical protein